MEIRFYRSSGEYGWMSNLYPCQVIFEGKLFTSSVRIGTVTSDAGNDEVWISYNSNSRSKENKKNILKITEERMKLFNQIKAKDKEKHDILEKYQSEIIKLKNKLFQEE